MSLWRSGQERSDVVQWATVRFAAWSALVLVVLVLGIFYASREVARDVAVSEARDRVRLTTSLVAPLVTDELRDGDRTAEEELRAVLMPQLEDNAPSHIRLWSEDGVIIWADDRGLIGREVDLPPNVRQLFGSERVLVQNSPVDQSTVQEVRETEMLEVYAGGMDADHAPVVYEAYYDRERFPRFELEVVKQVLPIAIGAVLLLQLAVLPLALLLARRVQRSEAARARLAEHALRASELERRRLAQELHDGVVQDLAGIGFVLPTLGPEFTDTPSGRAARQLLARVEHQVHDGIASLRSLMRDVYPPDLARLGLEQAVRTLAVRTSMQAVGSSMSTVADPTGTNGSGRTSAVDGSAGTQVTVEVEGDLTVPVEVARLCYRVVHEGLHNVVKHARAQHACVHLRRQDDAVLVEVLDDGTGPGAVATRSGADDGHLGLQLLMEAVTDPGGSLDLVDRPEGGAVLRAVVPLTHRLAPPV